MRKSAYFSDLAFVFTAVFLPALCFLRYRALPLGAALAASLLLAVGVCLPVAFLFQKKYNRKRLKNREQREAEKLILHLALLSQPEQAEFFLENLHCFFNDEKREIVFKNGYAFIQTDQKLAFPCFRASALTADETLPLLSYPTEKEIYLFCNELDGKAEGFLAKFPLITFDGRETYLRLNAANCLPERYKSEAAFQKKKGRRLQLWFKKQNAKPFFSGGAFLLISSLFSPFPYYYLICGILLVATSVFVKAFGKG